MPTLSPVTIGATEASLSIASFSAATDLGGLEPAAYAFVSYTMFAAAQDPV